MLKIKQWLGVASVALAAATVALPAQADELSDIIKRGELRVAVQTSGPLMSFMDKSGKRTGLAVEVAKRMADDLGVKLVLQDYEWKGLLPALLSGKADMVAADMTPTPQRAAQVLFSLPMFYADTVAVVPKDSPYKNFAELNKSGVTVGALGASTYAEVGKKMLPSATLKEFSGGSARSARRCPAAGWTRGSCRCPPPTSSLWTSATCACWKASWCASRWRSPSAPTHSA